MASGKFKLKSLSMDRIDLVTAGANPDAKVMIWKMADDLGVTMSDVVETVETPEVPAEEVNMPDETPTVAADDMVAKADFEALRKALEDANAKAASADERIAKMELDRRTAEYVAKAKELDNLGEAVEIGKMLLEANDGMSAESFQLLERTLKAANAKVEKGALFAQFGNPDADPVDVVARVTQLAKAKVDAGEAKTLEIAKLAVLSENKALQAEYMNSRGA